MKDKKIIVALVAVLVIAVIGIFTGGSTVIEKTVLGATGTRFPNGLSTDTTSPTSGEVRTTSLTVTAASTLTGTSTPAQFLFPIGGTISTSATGTAITLDANTTGPKLCFGKTAALAVRNRGIFSPSLVVSVGHATSSVTTTNLIASTTVATSTPGTSFFSTVPGAANEFVYPNSSEIMAIVGDITNDLASTTHMTNLTLDFRILCTEIEI